MVAEKAISMPIKRDRKQKHKHKHKQNSDKNNSAKNAVPEISKIVRLLKSAMYAIAFEKRIKQDAITTWNLFYH